jgi:hypothetical protein
MCVCVCKLKGANSRPTAFYCKEKQNNIFHLTAKSRSDVTLRKDLLCNISKLIPIFKPFSLIIYRSAKRAVHKPTTNGFDVQNLLRDQLLLIETVSFD